MAKILVLYYSSYGHIETMAEAVAAGARRAEGVEVTIKRVPELVPAEVAEKAGMKLDQGAAVATPGELANYDAIVFGTPTRFGNMAAQMRNFLDQTGGLWVKGALVGKVGSVFTSTSTQHGGQEPTITSFHTTLTSAWSLSACPIPVRACRTWTRSQAERPTAPAPWPVTTGAAARAKTSSRSPASRAGMWPESQASLPPDRIGNRGERNHDRGTAFRKPWPVRERLA